MGLRADLSKPDARASGSTQRASWYAFQRLASKLGDVRKAELLHPATLPTEVTWNPETLSELLVIFHYEVEEYGADLKLSVHHVYLLLVDPTADEDATFALQVRFAAATLSSTWPPHRLPDLSKQALLVAVQPLSELTLRAGSDTDLPLSIGRDSGDEVMLVDGTSSASLRLDSTQPRLVRATEELVFETAMIRKTAPLPAVLPTARAPASLRTFGISVASLAG